jgi:hypothetical protein
MAATHTGTCPVCFRRQRIVRGGLAKHGFRRPGSWETTGCWGTGKSPWEISPDATKEYIAKVLNPTIKSRREHVQGLTDGTVLVVYISTRFGSSVTVTPESVTVSRDWSDAPKALAELHAVDPVAAGKAAAETWEQSFRFSRYSDEWSRLTTWERAKLYQTQDLQREATILETEAGLLQSRIDGWKPGTLHEISPQASA